MLCCHKKIREQLHPNPWMLLPIDPVRRIRAPDKPEAIRITSSRRCIFLNFISGALDVFTGASHCVTACAGNHQQSRRE
jgi:hypothetical protein